jgi:hypothetical protein
MPANKARQAILDYLSKQSEPRCAADIGLACYPADAGRKLYDEISGADRLYRAYFGKYWRHKMHEWAGGHLIALLADGKVRWLPDLRWEIKNG